MSDVEAGWYADPQGSAQRRYWDGNSWTEHLEPIAAPPPVALAPPAPPPAPSPAAPAPQATPPVVVHKAPKVHRQPLPSWARYLGLAALVFFVIVPIFSPVAQHFVDTIDLNAEWLEQAFENPDELDTYQNLLRWSILITFWAVFFGAIGLLLRLGMVGLAKDRSTMKIAWRRWNVRRVEGAVSSASRETVTHTSGGVSGTIHDGSGTITGSVTTTTTRQDDFVVTDRSGATAGFRAINMNLNLAPGHEVCVVQLSRRGQHRLVSVWNRTSGHLFTDKKQVQKLASGMPGTSLLLVIGFLGSLGVTSFGDNPQSPVVSFACLGALAVSFAYQRVSRRRVTKLIETVMG